MMRNKKLIYIWVAVIAWMSFIFFLSSQTSNESNGLSTVVTERIVKVIEKAVPNTYIDIRSFNNIVRKNAHFFLFFILGILVSCAIKKGNISVAKGIMYALVICVLYAVSDEVHQIFVPGRGAQLIDVIIDSIGAAVGIACSEAKFKCKGKCKFKLDER